MSKTTKIMMIVAMFALSACATAATKPATATHLARGSACGALTDASEHVAALYSPDNIQSVWPVRGRVDKMPVTRAGLATRSNTVVGAEMTVLAQPGIDQAYAQRLLSCHAAGQSGVAMQPNDPLGAAGVASVRVTTQGPAHRVSIVGTDAQAGREILQRARALSDPTTSVDVMQIGAAPSSQASL